MKKALSEKERFLSDLAQDFRIDAAELSAMIGRFHRDMERGLAGEESSLKMIPSFAGRPTGEEKGRYLAVDLGGTHLRVMEAELDGGGKARIEATDRFVIPSLLLGGDGERIFDFIADAIKTSFAGRTTDVRRLRELAFTFSFPVEQLSVASGRLIHWTKGFTAHGVEGCDPAALLSEALKRNGLGRLGVAALTNDTVGTLAAGSYADPLCDMGVILGTGTNAGYVERVNRIGKLSGGAASAGEMMVNIEWGNFDGISRNAFDDALDGASSNPGRQRLEKMTSGMYMGEIARRMIGAMMKRGLLFCGADPAPFEAVYALTAEQMAMAAEGKDFLAAFGVRDAPAADRKNACEIFRIVSNRSARLAAAAMASVVLWMDRDLLHRHVVAIDGSLFQKYPGFNDAMRSCLLELLGDRADGIVFMPVQDGSGIGAAIVAAVAASSSGSSGVKRNHERSMRL